MPKLNTIRETREIELEVLQGGKVVVYTDPTAADMEKIMALVGDGSKQSILIPLSVLIKEWNIDGEDEKPLPITVENIGLLHYKDVTKIAEVIKIDAAALQQKKE